MEPEQNGLIVENIDNWFRVGRGRGISFFATGEEIQNSLKTSLLKKHAPYKFIGIHMIKQANERYVQELFECEVNNKGISSWTTAFVLAL